MCVCSVFVVCSKCCCIHVSVHMDSRCWILTTDRSAGVYLTLEVNSLLLSVEIVPCFSCCVCGSCCCCWCDLRCGIDRARRYTVYPLTAIVCSVIVISCVLAFLSNGCVFLFRSRSRTVACSVLAPSRTFGIGLCCETICA